MKFLLRLLAYIMALPPLTVALWVGRGWGFFIGNVLRIRRREILRNLAWALPEKSDRERHQIANAMYRHFGMTVIEILRMAQKPPTDILQRINGDAWHPILPKSMTPGKGAIAICAHVGNWEMLAAGTSQMGRPLGITVKDLKPPALDAFITDVRERHGTHIFRRKGSMRSAIRHIRQGGVLGFMMDQNTKRNDGVFVNFFGRPACTTTGLAQFAYLTGAPATFVLLIREPRGNHRMVCGNVIPPPPDLSDASVEAYTQTALDGLEKVIRQYPEQWIWMHRRWRTQPLPKPQPPSGMPASASQSEA